MPYRPRHLLVAAALVLAGCGSAAPAANRGPAEPMGAAVPSSPAEAPPPVKISYPARGSKKWITAPAQTGKVAGHSGQLLHYRVLVEQDIKGVQPTAFADTVRDTLADPRSWTAGGQYRLQRVGPGSHYDFTIYLATPKTKDSLCAGGSDGYTSCRNPHNEAVVLNIARWVKGAAPVKTSLTAYRQYMVNHEVGHQLGQGHMLCPGHGQPAPVMQQQTLGMHGCTPNSWPYPDRKHFYTGRSGAYNDPVPPPDQGN